MLPAADLGTSACPAEGGAGASVIVAELGDDKTTPTVFSTVEVSKAPWSFELSQWKTDANIY